MIDEAGLAEFIRKKCESICCKCIPKGHRQGDAWVIGDVTGAEGNSLYTDLSPDKAGQWYNFASCEEGILQGLLMDVLQVDLPGLVELIEHDFGINLHLSESGCPTAAAPESTPQQEEQKDEPKQVPAAGGKQLKERELVESLIERHGPPLYEGDNGRCGPEKRRGSISNLVSGPGSPYSVVTFLPTLVAVHRVLRLTTQMAAHEEKITAMRSRN